VLQVAQLNSLLALYMDMGGIVFATPSISEKGYLDVKITLSTLGGHSSVPPSHTVRADRHLLTDD
jgi:acetylornithine deacetylase/succinyl-diaminopimelate desuccinylase-like protein